MRLLRTSSLLACLALGAAAVQADMPAEFRRRINFLAMESGVPGIVEATPKLMEAGYFERVVAEFVAHRKALASTTCSQDWCRGLDVFLTRHVDPDEATMWTVDVYRILGPVQVKPEGSGPIDAHLVEAALWRGDEHKTTRFAVKVEGGKPVSATTRFETLSPLPPELGDNPSVAFQKRMMALKAEFPDLADPIAKIGAWYAASPMGFLEAVGKAWERFEQGQPDEPALRVKELLPTSVYWWMDDFVRPMRDESVEVLELSGPEPVKIEGEIKEGWVTKVRITPKAGGKAEERRFAALWREGRIEGLTEKFEPGR
jgi:hypothetical protein